MVKKRIHGPRVFKEFGEEIKSMYDFLMGPDSNEHIKNDIHNDIDPFIDIVTALYTQLKSWVFITEYEKKIDK